MLLNLLNRCVLAGRGGRLIAGRRVAAVRLVDRIRVRGKMRGSARHGSAEADSSDRHRHGDDRQKDGEDQTFALCRFHPFTHRCYPYHALHTAHHIPLMPNSPKGFARTATRESRRHRLSEISKPVRLEGSRRRRQSRAFCPLTSRFRLSWLDLDAALGDRWTNAFLQFRNLDR